MRVTALRSRVSLVVVASAAMIAALLGASAGSATSATQFGHITGTITKAPSAQGFGILSVTAFNVNPGATSPKHADLGVDGAYDIELPPGRYYLYAEELLGSAAWQYSGGTSVAADAKVIEVTANGTVRGDDFVLQPGATFEGRAFVGLGRGVPSNIFVMRRNHDDWVNVSGNLLNRDGQGNFRLSGLPAGTYVLGGIPLNYDDDAAAELYPGKDSPSTAKQFTVVTGQSVHVDLAYRRGGHLSAQVLRADGSPAAGTQVSVHFQPDVDMSPYEGLRPAPFPVTLDSAGRFALKGLSAGAYRVSVNGTGPDQSQYLTMPGGDPDDPASRLRVAAAQDTVVPLTRMRAAGTLAVKAVDQHGTPVPGVRANLADLDARPNPSAYVPEPFPGDPAATGPDGVRSFGPQQQGDQRHIYLVDPYGRFEPTFYGGQAFAQAIAVAARPGAASTYTAVMRPAVAQEVRHSVISGSPVVGSTLTVDPGTYLPSDVTLSFQWYSAGKDVPGATGRTFKVRSTDAGKFVGVKIDVLNRGRLAGYGTGLRTTIRPLTFSGGRVTLSDSTPRRGQRLTARVSGLSPSAPGGYWRWYRGNTRISGASSSAYTTRSADVGHTIRVVYTARRTGYATKWLSLRSAQVKR
jgi:hypothetical protein